MDTALLSTAKANYCPLQNLVVNRQFGRESNLYSTPTNVKRNSGMNIKMKTVVATLGGSSKPPPDQILRRDLVLLGLFSSASIIYPRLCSGAEDEVKMNLTIDEVNAYSYLYPTELPRDKFVFKWVESRRSERYSSAAPLSPDARLRIVSERLDFIDNLIISVAIGPPNLLFLKSKDKSSWSAKNVADSFLADKSALRVTSSQRLDETSVIDAHSSIVDGELYWYYEYLVRKSPTKSAQESNLYRHFVASTTERDGYLYTLNASTLSKQWDKMGPVLEKTMKSFRLLSPTENYVPPYKDPWRFW